MSENSDNEYPTYRWAVLAALIAIIFVYMSSLYIYPPLQYTIQDIFGITEGQYGWIFTAHTLAQIVLIIPIGLIIDKIGVRKSIGILSSIGVIGLFMRTIPMGFAWLFLAQVIFGIGMASLFLVGPKLIHTWFPPREMGMSTGLFSVGTMGAITLATGFIAPNFPGWFTGHYMYTAIAAILTVVFFVIVKDAPAGKEFQYGDIIEGAKRSLGTKTPWLLGMASGMTLSMLVAFPATIPGALNGEYGISMATGGMVVSVFTLARLVGALSIPRVSDRIENVKKMMMIVVPLTGVAIPLTFMSGGSMLLWVVAALAGFASGPVMPLYLKFQSMFPDAEDMIRPQDIAGAASVTRFVSRFWSWQGMPMIVIPLAIGYGYMTAYWVAAGIIAASVIFIAFLKDPYD